MNTGSKNCPSLAAGGALALISLALHRLLTDKRLMLGCHLWLALYAALVCVSMVFLLGDRGAFGAFLHPAAQGFHWTCITQYTTGQDKGQGRVGKLLGVGADAQPVGPQVLGGTESSVGFWKAFLFTEDGKPKSGLMVYTFCLSLVYVPLYMAAFYFSIEWLTPGT